MTTTALTVGTNVRCETRIGPPFPRPCGTVVDLLRPRGEVIGAMVQFGPHGPTLTVYLDEIVEVDLR